MSEVWLSPHFYYRLDVHLSVTEKARTLYGRGKLPCAFVVVITVSTSLAMAYDDT